MEPTVLCKIMGKHGSDKGHENINDSWHNYTQVYYKLFSKMQDSPLRVFELGIGTNNVFIKSNMGPNGKPGASLRGWAEFFPNASIFGADIDRAILFQTDRIRTYYCDQLSSQNIAYMWSQRELWEPFDIIIEDGLHEFDANVCFFVNSIHKLRPGGYYIIEDLVKNTLIQWKEKIQEWKIVYPELTFTLLQIPSGKNKHDNNLLIVHYPVLGSLLSNMA